MKQPPTRWTMTCEEVRQQLELFLDGMLPPAEDQAMRAHLLVCPGCRAEMTAVEGVETRLRCVFRDEAPPQELWHRIVADVRAQGGSVANRERRPSIGGLPRRAVIAATALLGIGVVFAGQRLWTTDITAAELMETPVDELRSFVDSGRPLDFTTADPAELRQWFVPRVDFPPPTPPTKAGLTLIGGRLCYFFRRRIAAYMYRADGHILSLYVMSDEDIERPFGRDVSVGDRPAAIREINEFAHVLWRDGPLYYSLVSDQPAARLVVVARAIVIEVG